MKDDWTEIRRRFDPADEGRYFAERDRKLIEERHRQAQSGQQADAASPESTTTEATGT